MVVVVVPYSLRRMAAALKTVALGHRNERRRGGLILVRHLMHAHMHIEWLTRLVRNVHFNGKFFFVMPQSTFCNLSEYIRCDVHQ